MTSQGKGESLVARALRGKAGAVTAALIGYLFFVEIVSGLNQGDVVILSDMQQYDSNDRVRIRN